MLESSQLIHYYLYSRYNTDYIYYLVKMITIRGAILVKMKNVMLENASFQGISSDF